jgi:hypothetical protein
VTRGNIETKQLREAVTATLEGRGYAVRPIVGRGQPVGVLLELTKGGQRQTCVVKTTRDRDIGFVWDKEKRRWATLASADLVAIGSVDDKNTPTKIEVYLLEATAVRDDFNKTLKARITAGHAIEDVTVWLPIDRRNSTAPSYVGSGFKEKALWSAVIDPALDTEEPLQAAEAPPLPSLRLSMAEAKPALAAYYGVSPEAVEITIRG